MRLIVQLYKSNVSQAIRQTLSASKKFELILHKYIFVVPLPTLMVSEFMHELGFTGIRCESGTVPAAVSSFCNDVFIAFLATDYPVGKAQ
jgi:hypothetical protein